MKTKNLLLGLCCLSTLGALGCGGGSGVPAVSGTRESGQSSLMGETLAGKCDPKNHERPFIIEWDATDMSQFEAYASNDVVVVKYEGCGLQVLDRCRDDSVRGSLGAYRPIDWTSGSLETIDIANEGELFAKLPLGSASLGGRVSAGEKFHMEYYVAGSRGATRDAVYKSDLERYSGCKGATHWVYGYNLGAFALGSATSLEGSIEGSAFGFGGGASNKKTTAADKKGGDLTKCKGDSAKEVEGCKVPIRLTLRAIDEGVNPDTAAKSAPETDAALNAAGQLAQKMEMSDEARAHYDAAQTKAGSKDGKGCLAELDKHDKLDPKNKSTDPKSALSEMRGRCIMLAGQCDAGKALVRKYYDAHPGPMSSPEQTDRTVQAYTGLYCQGAGMSARDQVLKALMELQQGAYMAKKTPQFCMDAYKTVRKFQSTVKPESDEDQQIASIPRTLYNTAATCLAKAGDCEQARKVFMEAYPVETLASIKDPKVKETTMASTFDSLVSKCKK